jgi:hypothetical protein
MTATDKLGIVERLNACGIEFCENLPVGYGPPVNPDGPEAAALIEELVGALEAVVPALEEEISVLTDSYTNRCGPDEGKVTDPDGLKWINEFQEPLKKIRAALAKVSPQ